MAKRNERRKIEKDLDKMVGRNKKIEDNLERLVDRQDETNEILDKVLEKNPPLQVDFPEFPEVVVPEIIIPEIKMPDVQTVKIEGIELIKGEQGDIGPRGPTGDQGSIGSLGPVGGLGPRGLRGPDGRPAKDGKAGKDGSPETPEQIRDKLQELKDEDRLDSSAIKNLPERVSQVIRERRGGGGGGSSNGANIGSGEGLVFAKKTGSGILNFRSILAGTNMTVTTNNGDITLDAAADPGVITGVTAGDGLTGGGTTGDVTLDAVGTSDRITVNPNDIDIASTYVGQTSLTTLGTIATGTWNGDVVANAYVAEDLTISGGTVNNSVIGGSTAASGTFTQVDIEAQGDLRLQDTTGGEYVALQAAGTTTSYTLTMPGAVGSSGQALRASDGAGALEWYTPGDVGDITSVVAGAGMTGGGTSGDVTLNVIGTADKITVSADALTIASTYVGQTSITTLGTIATGVWNGTAVTDAYVANDLTISGGTVNNSIIGGTTAAAGTFTQVDIEAEGDLRLQDATGGEYVAIQSPTAVTSYTLTMPAAVGASGQVLQTSDATGTLAWATVGGDITAVTAGDGLTGGGASGDVTLNVGGTTNRIDVSADAVDISTSYVGQSSITTLGTIGTGVWNSTVVGVAYGGTGLSSYVAGDIIYASDTTTLAKLAKGADTQVLTLASGVPTWATPTTGDITGVTAGDGLTGGGSSGDVTLNVAGTTDRITVSADAVDIAATYVGQTSIVTIGTITTGTWEGTTIAVDQGGTGLTAYTAGDILYASGTTTLAILEKGADTEVLTLAGGVPTWAAPTVGDITAVTAGAGMTGGGASGDVTLNVIGTANTITVSADAVTIASTYVGQSSITTLGTISTGIWNGTAIAATYGGTAIDSSGSTGVAQVSSGTWSISTALADGTTATTQSASDNSTKVATTAYVDAASGGSSPWTTTSNVVNLNTGTDSVTIGSTTAGGKLFVDGDADEAQLQIQGHSTQTSNLAIFEDSAGNAMITFSGSGGAVFNEQGSDADFRIEGKTDANLLVCDAGLDFVGIGVLAPGGKLEVQDNSTSPTLFLNNQQDAVANLVATFGGNNRATAADDDEAYFSFKLDDDNGATQEFGRMSWLAKDVTNTTKDGGFTFDVMVDNSLTERFSINNTRVQVTGDLNISGALTIGTALAVAQGGTGLTTFGGTNTLLYTTTADNMASITTGNSGLLVTNGSGVPSISSTIPDGVIATTQSASDNSTKVATTAYVDAQVATSDTLAEVLATGNTTGSTNIIVSASQSITTDTISETTVDAGVTIDSVLVKDNVVTATTFSGNVTGDLTGAVTATGTLADGVVGATQSADDNSTKIATTAYVETAVSAGGSPWTTTSNVVNLNTGTDTVTIGGTTAGGKLFIDGDANEIQLQVQAHSTQTSSLVEFQNSAAASQWELNKDGKVTQEGGIVAKGASFTLGDSGSTVTFTLASGGNNFNFRNTNSNKDMIFDYPATNGEFRFRTHSGSSSTDRFMMDSSGDFYVGNKATNASPSAGIITATGGNGTDVNAADLTLAGGKGTGTGTGGKIIFQTATPAGSTGSTLNSLATAMTISDDQLVGVGTTTPVTGMDINHSMGRNTTSVSDDGDATYTVLITDNVLMVEQQDSGFFGSTTTVALPAVSDSERRVITIVNTSPPSGMGQVTLDGNGGETINGEATKTLVTQYEAVTITCDGSEWFITSYFDGTSF
jgi:hypothetical protein